MKLIGSNPNQIKEILSTNTITPFIVEKDFLPQY
jgi:hypothetical protein